MLCIVASHLAVVIKMFPFTLHVFMMSVCCLFLIHAILDWDGEALQKPETPEVLKFIFRGAFVNRSAKLSCETKLLPVHMHQCRLSIISVAFSLPLGKTTTMHLTIRESQQNEQTTGDLFKCMHMVKVHGPFCGIW